VEIYTVTSTGQTETQGETPILVSPNPSNGMVYVRLSDESVTISKIELLDQTGRLVLSRDVEQSAVELTLDLDGVAPGLYMLSSLMTDGKVKTSRLTLQ